MSEYTVRRADWRHDHAALALVRRIVFIDEQGVPEDMEWDEHDAVSAHWLAEDDGGRAIGCARLLPDGHIGRMAVLASWRGRGVGHALLAAVLDVARARGQTRVALSAQTHAVDFYRRAGFETVGDEYDEAGIPHIAMQKRLA